MKLRRVPVLALWAATLAGGLAIIALRADIKSDLSMFLPQGATPEQTLLLGQLREGPAAQLVLMALDGAPAPTLAKISADFADRLRANAGIAYVANGAEGLSEVERQLLFDHRYLLSPATAHAGHFDVPTLRTALQDTLDRLASPAGALERAHVPADPTGEWRAVLAPWEQQGGPILRDGVWFSAQGERALLIVKTRAAAFDIDAQARTQEEIHWAFDAVASDGARLAMTGPGVFGVATRAAIQEDAWRLSLWGAGLVLLLLILVFRSFTLLALSVLPLVTGAVLGIAAVSLWFGYIHGITIAFGVTLIGVAGDYPVHLFTHARPHEPGAATLTRTWPTLRLGILTTVISYFAMVFSGFDGLAQLGLFAVAGLLAAGAVTRFVLPAFMERGVRNYIAPLLLAAAARGAGLAGRMRWVFIVIIAAAGAYLVLTDARFWQDDLASLSPIPDDAKRVDQALRSEMGAPDVRQLLVLVGDRPQTVLEQCERLTPKLDALIKGGAIKGYDAPCRYLPSAATQRARQTALPLTPDLREKLTQARAGLPFKSGIFEPFLDDVERAKTQLPLTPERLRGTTLGLRVESLLYRQSGQWLAAIPLREVAHADALAGLTGDVANGKMLYLDLKTESERMVTKYRDHALVLWGWGALALVAVLTVGLRSLVGMVRVLLPVAAALVLVCAILLAMGQPLSLFHLVSLLLVVGVGIDYALFFNRPVGDREERQRTALSLIVCCATTAAAFGVLMFSRMPVLVAIGTTVAIGAALALVLAAAFARQGLRGA